MLQSIPMQIHYSANQASGVEVRKRRIYREVMASSNASFQMWSFTNDHAKVAKASARNTCNSWTLSQTSWQMLVMKGLCWYLKVPNLQAVLHKCCGWNSEIIAPPARASVSSKGFWSSRRVANLQTKFDTSWGTSDALEAKATEAEAILCKTVLSLRATLARPQAMLANSCGLKKAVASVASQAASFQKHGLFTFNFANLHKLLARP